MATRASNRLPVPAVRSTLRPLFSREKRTSGYARAYEETSRAMCPASVVSARRNLIRAGVL